MPQVQTHKQLPHTLMASTRHHRQPRKRNQQTIKKMVKKHRKHHQLQGAHNMTRNIYRHGNQYEIRKYHNGKIHKYGSYHNLQDARYIRDCLEQINYGFREDTLRNISISNGKYYLRKQRGNMVIYSETFTRLIDAIQARDLLEANDWDVDNL